MTFLRLTCFVVPLQRLDGVSIVAGEVAAVSVDQDSAAARTAQAAFEAFVS